MVSLPTRVAEAVGEEVGVERVYVVSPGSNEGNSHGSVDVVPLPPGIHYEEQQFAAVMLRRGLDSSRAELA